MIEHESAEIGGHAVDDVQVLDLIFSKVQSLKLRGNTGQVPRDLAKPVAQEIEVVERRLTAFAVFIFLKVELLQLN